MHDIRIRHNTLWRLGLIFLASLALGSMLNAALPRTAHASSTINQADPPVCGNGICEAGEDACTCAADCAGGACSTTTGSVDAATGTTGSTTGAGSPTTGGTTDSTTHTTGGTTDSAAPTTGSTTTDGSATTTGGSADAGTTDGAAPGDTSGAAATTGDSSGAISTGGTTGSATTAGSGTGTTTNLADPTSGMTNGLATGTTTGAATTGEMTGGTTGSATSGGSGLDRLDPRLPDGSVDPMHPTMLLIYIGVVVVAAIAIPAFMKNARKAKTAEATTNTRYPGSANGGVWKAADQPEEPPAAVRVGKLLGVNYNTEQEDAGFDSRPGSGVLKSQDDPSAGKPPPPPPPRPSGHVKPFDGATGVEPASDGSTDITQEAQQGKTIPQAKLTPRKSGGDPKGD